MNIHPYTHTQTHTHEPILKQTNHFLDLNGIFNDTVLSYFGIYHIHNKALKTVIALYNFTEIILDFLFCGPLHALKTTLDIWEASRAL